MNKHKFPYIYDQCEDKTGYDEMIGRLTHSTLLDFFNINCASKRTTYWARVDMNGFDEFIDFIDGNGFLIIKLDDCYAITPF